MAHDPFEHVLDAEEKWQLIWDRSISLPVFTLFGHEFHIPKYIILELIAAGLAIAFFVPLCRRAQNGTLPRGGWWNAFESLLTFIRNEVARPSLGEHEADRFVPFLW